MKKIMKAFESLFCAGYLLFAFAAGVLFLRRGDAYGLRCAVMTFLLAGGDAFHLVPRIISNLSPEWKGRTFALGLGNLISSVTMTFFYVALVFAADALQPGRMPAAVLPAILLLAVVRVCLCAAPANDWFGEGGSRKWRLYRNLPFVGIGLVTVLYLTMVYALYLPAVLTVVSFICYMTVVLGVKEKPALGMMMIPKTICYIWMIAWFLRQ